MYLHKLLSKEGKGLHVDLLCPRGSVWVLILRSLFVEEAEEAGDVRVDLRGAGVGGKTAVFGPFFSGSTGQKIKHNSK